MGVGRLAAELHLIESMGKVIVELQAVLDLSFLRFLLLINHVRCDLLILGQPLFERLVKRLQPPAVKHATLREIMYNHRDILNISITHDKVVPLMMRLGVAIHSDIQMILLVLLSHVLKIAILEVCLKRKSVLWPALDLEVVIVDEIGVMTFDEFVGELVLELLVDEN